MAITVRASEPREIEPLREKYRKEMIRFMAVLAGRDGQGRRVRTFRVDPKSSPSRMAATGDPDKLRKP